MAINIIDPTVLLPKLPLFPKLPLIPKWQLTPKRKGFTPNFDLLNNILKIKLNIMQLKMTILDGIEIEEKEAVNKYRKYLQYPNAEIKALAIEITDPTDTMDEKAYKILRWVQNNIEYKSDFKSYGKMEYWAEPTITLKRKSGDCEDGAFLIHSLMLNAGIPWERIRTYAGDVRAGAGAATGGHGWTTYKRESDGEWVALDWCYYPNQKLIGDRTPMKYRSVYVDDWFYINLDETVETPYANRVRDPRMIGRGPKGLKINIYA